MGGKRENEKNIKTRNVVNEFANPKITLMAMDKPKPPSSKILGPHRRPMKLLMNMPSM